MRIIAGDFRGTALAAVGKGDAGAHLRPTTDRVRENIFNVLGNWIDFDGLIVLDAFAGTGALGLEALSRGAAFVTFADSGRAAQKLIRENIRITRTADRTRLIGADIRRLPATDTPADLIFLDPPYGKSLGEPALETARAQGWIKPETLVLWEEDGPQHAPFGFVERQSRRYGNTHITLLESEV